jgi:hypothetical protein
VHPHAVAHPERARAHQHRSGDQVSDRLLRGEAEDDGGARASHGKGLGSDAGEPERDQHAEQQREQPDQEGHRAGGAGIEPLEERRAERPMFTANAQPRTTSATAQPIRTGTSSPNSSSRYAQASITAAISGRSSAMCVRARHARCAPVSGGFG